MINQETIRTECEESPGYNNGTAYTMTKICCRIITQHGQSIPSWMAIREIIRKGSSGDINRGIKDFRQEHAELLRQMNGILPGTPTHLAPFVNSFWEAAVAAAKNEFAANTQRWQEQIEKAEACTNEAIQNATEAKTVIDRQHSQIEALNTNAIALNDQIHIERAGREQVERMFEIQTAEMNAQRDKIDATLKENKADMDRMLERLDGERRYSLLQIEEARTKATNDIATIRAQAQREKQELEINAARLSSTITELRTKFTDAERKTAIATQEITSIQERLIQAEANNKKLTEINQNMIALIKSENVAIKSPRLRS